MGKINPRNPKQSTELANLEWYDPGKNVVGKYFQASSIHGLQYLGKPKLHVCERFIWIILVILAICASGFLISKMWERYQTKPIVTILNLSPLALDEIPFPAVTICNLNNIKQSFVDGFVQTLRDAENYNNVSEDSILRARAAIHDIRRVCISTKKFATRFRLDRKNHGFLRENLGQDIVEKVYYKSGPTEADEFKNISNPTEILLNGSQSCRKMLLLCMWLGEVVPNCSDLFQEIATDFGVCCTFNMIPESLLKEWANVTDTRENATYVKDWKNSDLNVDTLVFTNATKKRIYPRRQMHPGRTSGLSVLLDPVLEEYFCSNTDSEGFIVGLNNALDVPRVKDDGIAVDAESEVLIGVKPDISIGDDSIQSFSPKTRNCYFRDEFRLAYYTKYTKLNCIDECIANLTFHACSCVQHYMPRKRNDSMCSVDDFECVENVSRNLTNYGVGTECNVCLPSCSSINYEAETTYSMMRPESTYNLIRRYPQFKNVNPRYVSLVHVYFKDDSAYPKLRKEDFSVIDLLSNSGGLLGLCMGLSALSLLEILYHCTIRPLFRCYRRIAQARSNDDIRIQLGLAMPSYQTAIHGKNQQNNLATLNKHQTLVSQSGSHLSFGDKRNLFTIIRTGNTNSDTEPRHTMFESDFETPYLKNFVK